MAMKEGSNTQEIVFRDKGLAKIFRRVKVLQQHGTVRHEASSSSTT
jgi:hypothetical protein